MTKKNDPDPLPAPPQAANDPRDHGAEESFADGYLPIHLNKPPAQLAESDWDDNTKGF